MVTPFSQRDLGQVPSALCCGVSTGCLFISVKVSGEEEEGEGDWERESQGSDKKARNLAQRAVAWRVGGLGASRSLQQTRKQNVCVCVCVFTCHSSRVEVRGQLGGSFLPPYGFQRWVASVSTHRAFLLPYQLLHLRKEDNTRTHVKGFECGVRRKQRPAGTWLPVLSHRRRTAVFMDVPSMCWVLACTRSRVQNA